jgi:hypothetical protein
MMNDPEYYEKFRYIDIINDYNMIIEERQKLYDNRSVTNRFIRARSVSIMKPAQKDNMTSSRSTRQELQ